MQDKIEWERSNKSAKQSQSFYAISRKRARASQGGSSASRSSHNRGSEDWRSFEEFPTFGPQGAPDQACRRAGFQSQYESWWVCDQIYHLNGSSRVVKHWSLRIKHYLPSTCAWTEHGILIKWQITELPSIVQRIAMLCKATKCSLCIPQSLHADSHWLTEQASNPGFRAYVATEAHRGLKRPLPDFSSREDPGSSGSDWTGSLEKAEQNKVSQLVQISKPCIWLTLVCAIPETMHMTFTVNRTLLIK